MEWTDHLESGEQVLWQGRPAPRCFTFRNWLHSLFGVVILLAAVAWFYYGIQLGDDSESIVYGLIPVPFLLAGIYLSVGHLIVARLEWEHVFYALTDRRLIAVRGIFRRRLDFVLVSAVVWFELRPLGAQLGTVRVRCRDLQQKLTISCVEYPRQLTGLLEASMEANGIELNSRHE